MTVKTEPGVVVVGGANMDIKARSLRPLVAATSNPGTVDTTPGGVGRNIAENLARLSRRTYLVAAVGSDAMGEQILAHTSAAGVRTEHVVVGAHPTGTYLAVLDDRGELVVGISDMAATDNLSVEHLARSRDLVAAADLLVLDGNLPGEVLGWLLDLAASGSVPVLVEPVSVAKAQRLAPLLSPGRPVLAITPNVDELGALVGADVPNTRPGIAAAARLLHERGVTHVWVRRGRRGSVLSSRAPGAGAPDHRISGGQAPGGSAQAGEKRPTVTVLTAPRTPVVDVTGAGDAMTAAFAHALLRGDTAVEAAEYGHRAAALTVASRQTVRADLTDSLIATLEPPTHRADQGAP
jgi:pseudouridine kinase